MCYIFFYRPPVFFLGYATGRTDIIYQVRVSTRAQTHITYRSWTLFTRRRRCGDAEFEFRPANFRFSRVFGNFPVVLCERRRITYHVPRKRCSTATAIRYIYMLYLYIYLGTRVCFARYVSSVQGVRGAEYFEVPNPLEYTSETRVRYPGRVKISTSHTTTTTTAIIYRVSHRDLVHTCYISSVNQDNRFLFFLFFRPLHCCVRLSAGIPCFPIVNGV